MFARFIAIKFKEKQVSIFAYFCTLGGIFLCNYSWVLSKWVIQKDSELCVLNEGREKLHDVMAAECKLHAD
jgi:hypothetical protein